MVSKPKKPFRVFEAGAGKFPIDLIKKAARSERLGKKREFIGVDYDLFSYNLEAALKQAKVGKSPKNLRTSAGCAIRVLEKLPKESQNLVFAGLVVHQIFLNKSSPARGVMEAKRFLSAAKRALAPNGRLVLIQHLKDRAFFEQLAKEGGFRVYSRELTEAEAKKSESPFLNQIATSKGREEVVKETIRRAANQAQKAQEIQDLAQERNVKSPYDLHKPILFILRK